MGFLWIFQFLSIAYLFKLGIYSSLLLCAVNVSDKNCPLKKYSQCILEFENDGSLLFLGLFIFYPVFMETSCEFRLFAKLCNII